MTMRKAAWFRPKPFNPLMQRAASLMPGAKEEVVADTQTDKVEAKAEPFLPHQPGDVVRLSRGTYVVSQNGSFRRQTVKE